MINAKGRFKRPATHSQTESSSSDMAMTLTTSVDSLRFGARGFDLVDALGFTLIEILVATGLVGLVALAVAPLMLMAVQTSAVAQEATELTLIGSERMEILRALSFNDAELAAGGSTITSTTGYSVDPYEGDADRYIRWQITDASASRKHIELAVGVRDSVWGPPREILLETYRTDLQ